MIFGAAMLMGLVLTGAILLGLLWGFASYNGFVAARTEYTEAFARVLARLLERNAQIPVLVETALVYMRHERAALESVNAAVQEVTAVVRGLQGRLIEADRVQELQQAEARLGAALGRLKTLSEMYPELRKSPGMVRVSNELGIAENEVLLAQQGYNALVLRYNTMREPLPLSVLSAALGFGDAPALEDKQVQTQPQQPQQPELLSGPPATPSTPSTPSTASTESQASSPPPQRLGTLKA